MIHLTWAITEILFTASPVLDVEKSVIDEIEETFAVKEQADKEESMELLAAHFC